MWQSNLISDDTIIKNLISQGYSYPIEEGNDGRCLFWSILPQLTEEDIQQGLSSNYSNYFENWNGLPSNDVTDDQLDRLRQMALMNEEHFIHSLSSHVDQPEKLSNIQKERVFELYKDIIQQLHHLDTLSVCKHLKKLILKDLDSSVIFLKQFLYCLENFPSYKQMVQKKYNWAGTSELIAIGHILKREVKAFGRDLTPTIFDYQGNVLPYYGSQEYHSSTPIVIFQCDGGGHYQRLIPPKTSIL